MNASRNAPATYEPTTTDLSAAGYARTFPPFWLRPNGLSIVSEPDALRELAEQLNRETHR